MKSDNQQQTMSTGMIVYSRYVILDARHIDNWKDKVKFEAWVSDCPDELRCNIGDDRYRTAYFLVMHHTDFPKLQAFMQSLGTWSNCDCDGGCQHWKTRLSVDPVCFKYASRFKADKTRLMPPYEHEKIDETKVSVLLSISVPGTEDPDEVRELTWNAEQLRFLE